MSDDIGSYYDRKREAGNKAWRALQDHKATCRDCVPPDSAHLPKRCKERDRLYAAWLDAGNTGD